VTVRRKDFEGPLDRAHGYALGWLESLDDRPVGPREDADAVLRRLVGRLPDAGLDPTAVVEELAAAVEPGLMAIGSGRFFGWVMGGTQPASLAADWLVSAWDQNAGMRSSTPGVVAVEESAQGWILDLLGLPEGSDVGFVTGATMANVTGLAAARDAVLAGAGWDVHADGLTGGPRVHVLVGAERHDTVDVALRYLGLGAPTAVPADGQGRIRVDALENALAQVPDGAPVIVALQAGNLHSGAFDPFADAIEAAHARGAWVHVDGAFGLWAAASPRLRHLTVGMAGADSWATDAHKTLSTPYDCGVAIVRDPVAMRTAFGVHADYLVENDTGPGNPYERTPELSRRARGVPVWAVLRSLGRTGVAELVERLVARAGELAAGMAAVDGAAVANEVCFTQVCVTFGDDARTEQVAARLVEDGGAWMSGSRWHDRAVLRISVSNWSTDDDDVARSLAALQRAAAR
jgi:glutamate/tyrosine decarboxylase-like PLP-dependent enzyme